ncbi:hypothetical protein, partial [Alistipes sp.]|uniref:hypothetical protein n=1 Tax=Alistipes sp. TaxID=1872444 RepID=UPI003A86F076
LPQTAKQNFLKKFFNDGFTANPSFFVTDWQITRIATPQTVSKYGRVICKIFYEILKELAK